MSVYEFASKLEGPWLFTTQRTISDGDVPANILLFRLDAASMRDFDGLYREISSVLKFPDYFGNNLNALDECITDLEWLPADGYLGVIKNANCLLSEESDDALREFLFLLDSAGEEWSMPLKQGGEWDRGGVPFHVVLELNKSNALGFQERLNNLKLPVRSI